MLLQLLITPMPSDSHPKCTMSSPVVKIAQEMMEKKRIKTNIGVGYVVKAKVGKMEENTREGRIRRMRKDLMGCVQAVAGKKKLVVQFKKKTDYRNDFLFNCVCMFKIVDMPWDG